jgi:probable rRNA maturation factor
LSLSFRVESQRWQRYLPFLRRSLKAAHEILRPALREMSVALVGDARMGELHERFMGIAEPTDVLTFPLETDARGRVTEGDVVICVTEARRRAGEHRVRLEHELLLYALHGLLHLSGYDDRTQRAYDKMHRTEDAILQKLGIGAVFAPLTRSLTPAPLARRARRKPGRAR